VRRTKLGRDVVLPLLRPGLAGPRTGHVRPGILCSCPTANLELVRSLYADWERGDWSGRLTWAHPEIELVAADGPDRSASPGLQTCGDLRLGTASKVPVRNKSNYITERRMH
jgi:hypothetical protein